MFHCNDRGGSPPGAVLVGTVTLNREPCSGNCLLENFREMPVPVNLSSSLHYRSCCPTITGQMHSTWLYVPSVAGCKSIDCTMLFALFSWLPPLDGTMCVTWLSVSCATFPSTVKHWRCSCSKPPVDVPQFIWHGHTIGTENNMVIPVLMYWR